MIVLESQRIPVRLSCEFFPTASAEGASKLDTVRQELSVLPWEYFSVTYGAGGSTRERTLECVKRILAEKSCPIAPHLTCVAASQEEIGELLDYYQSLGINRMMALRGDIPSGMYQLGDLYDAKALVGFIRQRWGEQAHILVAAYPETHPRARCPQADLHFFVEKVRAGASEAVTQYFFNADAYLRFRDEAVKAGVNIPIVPGIMPITNYTQLARFSDACGAEIPRWLRKRLESLQDDVPSLLAFGADVVAELCARLLREGVPALHFYSMNRADAILAITQRLGWTM